MVKATWNSWQITNNIQTYSIIFILPHPPLHKQKQNIIVIQDNKHKTFRKF